MALAVGIGGGESRRVSAIVDPGQLANLGLLATYRALFKQVAFTAG